MNRNLAISILRAVGLLQVVFLLLFGPSLAQDTPSASPSSQAAISALFVSDIHFDPFWDPAKVLRLASAPSSQWRAILAAAPSPGREERFQSLQQGCRVRGEDTSFVLFDSSLKAMRAHATGARFVTVSGDLVAHGFDCKFRALFPHSTPEAYRAFVEKTLDYVIGELNGAFAGVPVYAALGNNDSDCGDYRLDARSEFLAAVGREVAKNFSPSERPEAEESFAAGGYYSVSLPAPIVNARLLVLDDIFMSKNYATCAGKADPAASDAQLAWLRQQLAEARANKQKVWVMGHIPPGVDLYATAKRMADLCGGQKPVMFLSSEKLADTLAEYGDVVRLAIFAHTHMDELRLLKPMANGQGQAAAKSVALKMVPSISPINGNRPSITLARIDPATAELRDYRVFTASNQTGVGAKWTEEYNFARSFHEAAFSASSVSRLVAGFAADSGAKTPASQNYIGDFSAGNPSPLLQIFWPQYVCTLSNDTAEAFRACVCPAAQ